MTRRHDELAAGRCIMSTIVPISALRVGDRVRVGDAPGTVLLKDWRPRGGAQSGVHVRLDEPPERGTRLARATGEGYVAYLYGPVIAAVGGLTRCRPTEKQP